MNQIKRRLALLESKATPEEIVIRRHITSSRDAPAVIVTRRISAPRPGGTP